MDVFLLFLLELSQSFLDASDCFNDVLIASSITHAETVWVSKCITAYSSNMCLFQEIHGEVCRIIDGVSTVALAEIAVALREEIERSLWHVDFESWYFLCQFYNQIATTLKCLAHFFYCTLVECIGSLCSLLANRTCATGVLTLELVTALDDPFRTSQETDSPSSHGVCFRYTVGNDDLFLHAWFLSNAVVLAYIINVFVDFICQHENLRVLSENFSRYSPVPGYPDLRKAIVAKLKKENGLDYTMNEVIVGTGGKQCVCNAVLALVNPGDEVIIPAPYWVSYPQMVKLAGGTPVIVNAGFDQDFKMTAEQLENAITEKTKMLILCSPSNPTGSVYSKEELAALADVLKKHPEVFVLADEIYEHINYIGKHHSIAQEPGMKEQVIIANGVSKAYAMTGWRIGFLAGPEWIIKGCNKLQGQYTSGTCSVSQKAAEAAYTLDQGAVEEMRVAFERRRNLIVKLAKEVPGLEVNMPQGAFYLFPKCNSYFGKSNGEKTINNSTDFAMYLLEEAHVATVGGDAFGDPDCFRMSYATSDENIVEAIRRIKEALGKLK